MTTISKAEFDRLFRKEVKKIGGPSFAAIKFDCSSTFIRNIIAGRELPSKKICKHFGLEPVKQIKYRYKAIEQ